MPAFPLTADEVRKNAYAIPFGSPSYGAKLPLRIVDRESLSVSYRTDLDQARRLVPEPLEVLDPIVTLTLLTMEIPGLGKYAELAQTISASYDGEPVGFRPIMFCDTVPAILQGREIWGLPKKYGRIGLAVNNATLTGTLHFDDVLVARATMGYRYEEGSVEEAREALATPGAALKIIPDVDGSPRILELVRLQYSGITVKSAWTGPTALELNPHALAPLADLPVHEIVGSSHTVYDMELLPGAVLHDYLAS